MSGWDHPDSPRYYEAFCRSHSRYARANAALISHAHIQPAMRILDLAAGTGRTAEAALRRLGEDGRILCVEPSAAMRAEGMRRLTDPRVTWCPTLDGAHGPFDRILCGAAIWQLEPAGGTLGKLAGLLAHGGALCFNIPSLYLLEPDEPGGGADPLLLALPSLLAAPPIGTVDGPAHTSQCPLERGTMQTCLREAGLHAQSWAFRVRLTQEAYAAWLKIPMVSNGMLAGSTPDERARRIDAALELVDRSAWKWERWSGWTAWKR